MATPSPQHFAALARSSPWRWRDMRFTAAWRGRLRRAPVRAWVRRPDALRVEDLNGTVRQADRHGPSGWPERSGRPAVTVLSAGDRNEPALPADQPAVPPTYDDAGLVTSRPQALGMPEDPMYDDYHWVAMLDPAELADGRDHDDAPAAPVEIRQLGEVDHHGRPVWEAVVQTTEAYTPRCSCSGCALLFGAHSEQQEVESGGTTVRSREPRLRYPDAYRVRLDVATGVCVYTEEIGGSYPGTGHELRIETVDEDPPHTRR